VDIIAEREHLDKKVPGPVTRFETKKKPAPRVNVIGENESGTTRKYHTGYAFDYAHDEEATVKARLKARKKPVLQRLFNREKVHKKEKEIKVEPLEDLSSSSSSQ